MLEAEEEVELEGKFDISRVTRVAIDFVRTRIVLAGKVGAEGLLLAGENAAECLRIFGSNQNYWTATKTKETKSQQHDNENNDNV